MIIFLPKSGGAPNPGLIPGGGALVSGGGPLRFGGGIPKRVGCFRNKIWVKIVFQLVKCTETGTWKFYFFFYTFFIHVNSV